METRKRKEELGSEGGEGGGGWRKGRKREEEREQSEASSIGIGVANSALFRTPSFFLSGRMANKFPGEEGGKRDFYRSR